MRILALSVLFFVASALSAEPNDTFGAAEALIRYAAGSYPLVDEKSAVCISVEGEGNLEALLTRLKDLNLHIVPCGGKTIVTRLPVSKPQLQPDGNFLVHYGYFVDCENCAEQGKAMSAVMSHDGAGWHILHVQGGVSL